MNAINSPMMAAADFDFTKEASKAGSGMTATAWTPSDNAMASHQLSKLLASDSKLMTQARGNAQAAAARRGLLNSSIAAEAGEAAAIQSALPIAQQDAGTWGRSEEFNASAANDFARDANAFGRNAALTKYQGVLAQEAQGRDQSWRSGEAALDRSFQTGERTAAQAWQAAQAEAERGWRTGERLGSQDFSAGQSALDRQQQVAMQRDDQAFRSAQAGLDRQQQVTLQQNSQEWQAAQQRLSQQFQMDFEKFRLPMNMMAGFQDRMQGFVTQIMSDPNLDAAAKDQAIKNYYAYSQQTMGWMSTFFGQSMPNMAGGPSIQPPGAPGPSAQQPGGVQTGGQGVGPGASIGVPPPMLSAVDGGAVPDMASPIVRIPDFSGMTPGDVYRSGDGELIRRYRESLR